MIPTKKRKLELKLHLLLEHSKSRRLGDQVSTIHFLEFPSYLNLYDKGAELLCLAPPTMIVMKMKPVASICQREPKLANLFLVALQNTIAKQTKIVKAKQAKRGFCLFAKMSMVKEYAPTQASACPTAKPQNSVPQSRIANECQSAHLMRIALRIRFAKYSQLV